MKILYNIAILIFKNLAGIAAVFSLKTRQWIEGQKQWRELINSQLVPGDKVLWVHCSSLGEFEQGRPVIEEIKKQKPGLKILVTFFSPSGYEIRKNYKVADCVCYLPADTPSNVDDFLDLVKPVAAVIVKYEFWHNHISGLHRRNIPVYLISAIFRPGQHFFRWYGSFFRKILEKFEMIFVQDKASADLLSGIGITKVILAGDTRFDRVVQIAGTARDILVLESFRDNEKMFIAGSSWEPDEEIYAEYINAYPGRMKWVFAPHEIDEGNISRLEKLFSVKNVRFSKYSENDTDARVLIVDNIGMLSSAYRYAYVAGVGGGFGKGIHNILEPACWGIPVLYGPKHEKFREAIELLKVNGGLTYNSFDEFRRILDRLLDDDAFYLKSASSASHYVSENTGATKLIMGELMHRI